jgi:uncharacterized phage infection (PIP) family protein YhgE
MGKRGEGVSRGEVTEKVARHREGLAEKGKELDQTVADIETIRKTLEALQLQGTSETAEEVERAIEGAEDVSVDEFGQESGQLEQVQKESEAHEGELHERSDATTSDLGRISDASGHIVSDAANKAFLAAKDAALRDLDFLAEQARRARADLEDSRRQQEDRGPRVGK